MPLLSATGATAEHLCVTCQTERRVTPTGWKTDETDPSIVSVTCPTCGSTEFFSWHDWVYVTQRPRRHERFGTVLGPEEPDPDHFGARQMVLIERVARALGRQRVQHPQPERAYPRAPQAPDPEDVRRVVRRVSG